MEDFPQKLAEKLAERKDADALRSLKVAPGLVDFSSNDYLGLAGNEGIYSWAGQLVAGASGVLNGATGSRLLTGNYELYTRLEALLEQVHGAPALVFNSGYDANMGFFASVPQRGDIVFYDEYAHASIRDGIRMGLARSYKFRHNDLEGLKAQIKKNTAEPGKKSEGRINPAEVYVVTESVFSMDGDSPDLSAMVKLCKAFGCRLVVDEAHALGVQGTGAGGMLMEMGLQGQVFARIITFGKALGAHGAAIIGEQMLKDYLLNFARSFIYTTALSPHSVATLLAAHHFVATESGLEKQKELRDNIGIFRQTVSSLQLEKYFIASNSPIHSCLIPGNTNVKKASEQLRQKGFDVRPILSPTVPAGQERLRFCLHSFNTRAQMEHALETLQLILD